jgi:hypothetical protein
MTDWDDFVDYVCRHCRSRCLNRCDDPATEHELCHECYDLTALELDGPAATSERAEGAAPSHGGPTDGASASPRAERRGESQRESPAAGPERESAVRRGDGSQIDWHAIE